MAAGTSVLIENMGESIDAVLNPVIMRCGRAPVLGACRAFVERRRCPGLCLSQEELYLPALSPDAGASPGHDCSRQRASAVTSLASTRSQPWPGRPAGQPRPLRANLWAPLLSQVDVQEGAQPLHQAGGQGRGVQQVSPRGLRLDSFWTRRAQARAPPAHEGRTLPALTRPIHTTPCPSPAPPPPRFPAHQDVQPALPARSPGGDDHHQLHRHRKGGSLSCCFGILAACPCLSLLVYCR